MTDYKPGTVAEIGWRMTSGRERALRTPYGWQTETGILVEEPTNVRPLVVLDPDDYDSVNDLVQHSEFCNPGAIITGLTKAIQRGLRAVAPKPARIPEPGLWGVVRARLTSTPGATVWTAVRLDDGDWRVDDGGTVAWDDLIDPTLIREGVES